MDTGDSICHVFGGWDDSGQVNLPVDQNFLLLLKSWKDSKILDEHKQWILAF